MLERSVVGVLELLMWVMTRGATREISLDLSCMSQLLTSLTRLAHVEGVVDGCKEDVVKDTLTGRDRGCMRQISKLATDMLSLFDNN